MSLPNGRHIHGSWGNTRGHTQLFIKENGDVCIQPIPDGEETRKATLPDFPAKVYWQKLVDVLVKGGLVVLDPAGEAYDALEAQAVATVPDEEAFDETVAEVYQKGYKMGKKVLRPAMVTVTTGGPKRPKEESPED